MSLIGAISTFDCVPGQTISEARSWLISEALAMIDPAETITLSAEQKAAVARALGEEQVWNILEIVAAS